MMDTLPLVLCLDLKFGLLLVSHLSGLIHVTLLLSQLVMVDILLVFNNEYSFNHSPYYDEVFTLHL